MFSHKVKVTDIVFAVKNMQNVRKTKFYSPSKTILFILVYNMMLPVITIILSKKHLDALRKNQSIIWFLSALMSK